MSQVAKLIRSFAKDDEAATMPEYALMVALIAVFCIAAVGLLGGNISARFNQIAGAIGAA